ncbi:MAG: cobalamin B12-binding domain-containing protein [Myxococcales bacterium]|nr:cobalamin B12-binding domain-containing protein [Myxococcales bacterium]
MSTEPARAAAPADEAEPLRFVTAASLFDGHDAAINIMRRILQAEGAEVIHLGHDRSVAEIVDAAIEEDAHGIAVSSYQGGHMEFFTYMVQRLRERGRGDIGVFGGGGGTITDREIADLHAAGVGRIYSVEDGRKLGLVGMIRDMMRRARRAPADFEGLTDAFFAGDAVAVAQVLTHIERLHAREDEAGLTALRTRFAERPTRPVLGITGVGGAGKSSLTDELVRRALERFPRRTVAVLSVDPTRRRSGGALLGDRIRMNAITDERAFMRSMATRAANAAVPAAVRDALKALAAAGYDLVILETAGIGQSGSEVVDLADVSLYVMTPEFGAPSQLEKIDMLDFADVVALNKADKQGADDARRYVAKQVQRNRQAFDRQPDDMPVFACMASRFGDAGVDALFAHLMGLIGVRTGGDWGPGERPARAEGTPVVVPPERVRYLSDVSAAVRDYHARGEAQAKLAAKADGLRRALEALGEDVPAFPTPFGEAAGDDRLKALYDATLGEMEAEAKALLEAVPALRAAYESETHSYTVRGRAIEVTNHVETLSGTKVAKVALPQTRDWGDLLRWRWRENVPGAFPFTAGVFPYKRSGEDPTRMFAGEGHPERTNRRFHYVSRGQPAARLSTAFDSVTLYGRDPDRRPDIYGKVGNSGVSVATLDDAKRLYSGFDLSAPTTSVSMTINGPAPMLLAMFLNTAIDQNVEKRLKATGRWDEAQKRIATLAPDGPTYRGELPPGHDGAGLGLLGVSGDQLLPPDEYAEVKAETLRQVRGTVQADILKEDQAQNTCIFSTEFALKMMGDIQAWFIDHAVRNFYSVSISGYHIAEAGANPITQLAFTLANGFTYVEYYKARGMDPDAFARNLSFFFSNGVDAEYAVIGRVARRIWAVALRALYGAGPRSQQLKYHIQTSGRSLHAQEIDFNDIRTTLQALYAIADNCNSLHTNAFDEAITTPTEASVRRALAIQLIINRELGLTKNENPFQGSYFIERLTDLVEEAVLAEFDRLTQRGGVLGAMEVMYQRSKIQEESLLYEHKKHAGELPVIGVNTFLPEQAPEGVVEVELIRASDGEKQAQLDGLAAFHARNAERAPLALARLRKTAIEGGNLFAELMETVKCCSLGQITHALFDVGGQYRRNM